MNQKKLRADQRWQRALALWMGLGFWEKVYYLSARIQDEAQQNKKPMNGDVAFQMARVRIEQEGKDGQQSLAI